MSVRWLDLWNSKDHQDYLDLYTTYISTSSSVNHFSLESPNDVIIENMRYRITPPRYGDAYKALNEENDAARKREMSVYIRIFRSLNDRKQNLGMMQYKSLDFVEKVNKPAYETHESSYVKVPIVYIEVLPKIETLGVAETTSSPVGKKEPKTRKVRQQPTKPKKTVKSKSPVSRETKIDFINTALSRSVGEPLPFKKHEECTSRSTKSHYYISKSDLIQLIKQHPRLLNKVGPKHTSLTKEQICDKLFAKSPQ